MNRYSTVQRPEAALQRANDFISVGKDSDALNALYDVVKVCLYSSDRNIPLGASSKTMVGNIRGNYDEVCGFMR
jgi:hypothetical protein